MTTTTLKASILTRISVDRDESDSVERQEAELRILAAQHNAEVVAVHIDRGVSGAATKRPALDAWLADAESGRANLLLAWDWSRISRTGLRSVAQVVGVLESSGSRLITKRDSQDSASPAFGIIATIVAETAKAERDAIRDRVKSRQSADRASGRWIKPAPFGYDVVDGRLVPGAQAPLLREMVTRYIAGESLRSLTGWLNESGVAPPRAAEWGVSSVRHILASPSSAGMLPHNGDVMRGPDGAPMIVADPPVISLAEHRAVLDRTAANPQRKGSKPIGERHPLSGLLRCECGRPVVYQSRIGAGRNPRFRCAQVAGAGTHPKDTSWLAPPLLETVKGLVLARLGSSGPEDEWVGQVAIRLGYAEAPAASAEIAAAREEIAEVEALMADAEDARFSGGGFRGDTGKARFESLMGNLTARLQAAQAVAERQTPVVDVGAMTDPTLWEDADWESLRALFLATLTQVTIADGVPTEIDWR
jgi:DNA invertase Pin-like site-specific DNA recombinase